MPNTIQAPTAPAASTGKVKFIASHRPALEAGEYTLKVSTLVETTKTSKIKSQPAFESVHTFAVGGERFTILPGEVASVFPPDGSSGDHSNVLPHIALKRTTLPWERPLVRNDNSDTGAPWLAVLLLDESEAATTDSVALDTLVASAKGWPGVALEVGQATTDKATVLRLPKPLAAKLLPDAAAMPFLAHVRQGLDDSGAPEGADQAVVLGSRLPKKGSVSTAHLVSLESRFTSQGFDYSGADDGDTVAFVSLYSWRFSCPDDEVYRLTASSFVQLANVGKLPAAAIAKLQPLADQEYFGTAAFVVALKAALGDADATQYNDSLLKYGAYRQETFKGLLLGLNRAPSTLRLPARGNADLDAYLAMGATLLPHAFRQGDALMSWYRGPLVPGIVDADISLPAQAADALLRYDANIGMLDTSYAAAWELGRLLALKNKAVSIPLYNWKRANAQNLKQAENCILGHLPFQQGHAGDELDPPPALQQAFDRLALLEGVPFNYIVPDAAMLPVESIRFFKLDPLWIECLLDGVFSVGRVTEKDKAIDAQPKLAAARANPFQTVSGFLLRSDLVSGWPDLLIDGYRDRIDDDGFAPDGELLPILRRQALSPQVLLCLFAGEVKTVDIHLKPESIHFGLDPAVDSETHFYKELRDSQGVEQPGLKVDPIAWRSGDAAGRAVDMSQLVADVESALKATAGSFTSADFALQMIEGVEKVRIRIQK